MKHAAARAAMALACLPPMAGQAQDGTEVTFGSDVFDVTGAGNLHLGNIDIVLTPYRRAFTQGSGRLAAAVTIDAQGAVTACRFQAETALSEAGEAFCAHTLGTGRFRQDPLLELDYSLATYRFVVRLDTDRRARGKPSFRTYPAYPLERQAVRFGSFAIPPESERLKLADLDYREMTYPQYAMENAIEADVIVAVSFDTKGRVARCRPVRSSNTARIAYETCFEARRKMTLLAAPDPRPYVWMTRWRLAD
jgi:hypothetical protein